MIESRTMNTEFRKTLPGWRCFDTDAAVDAITPVPTHCLIPRACWPENLVRRCDPATLNASLSQLIERKRIRFSLVPGACGVP